MFETAPVHWESDDGQTLSYDTWTIGPLRFLSGTSAPLRIERSAEDVRREPYEYFSISLLLSGVSTVSSAGRSVTYEPGDLLVIDERHPYVLEASATTFISMMLPRRQLLHGQSGMKDFSVNAQAVEGLVVTTLSAFFRTMIYNREPLSAIEEECIGRAGFELFRGVLQLIHLRQDKALSINPTRESVRVFVLSNLTLRNLSPELVAAALGVSRSSLYRAFATTGGVSHFIQTCRLDAVRDLLTIPGERRSISELAATFNFASTAHFSRAFKTRNGVSPVTYRAVKQNAVSKDPVS